MLLLERDQIGFDRQLGDHLERSGVATSEAPGDGYTAMMAHPQVSRPPLAEFESVGRWLSEAPAAGPSRAVPAASREPIEEVEIVSSGRRIRERPFTLDLSSGRVFGILSEPADAERGDMGAVLLNAGALRRIGPGRLWVDLARSWAGRGIPTLRLDLRGIGDADGDAGAYARNASFYVPELVDQVLETLDALEQRGVGSRFVLGGLCSGAYWSFHAALRDQRVRSALLMNPMILYWDRSITAERDAREVKAAIRESPWRRLVSGEIRPAHVRTAVRTSAASALRAPRDAWARRSRKRRLDRAFDALRAAGKRVLFVFGQREVVYEEFALEGRLDHLERWPNVEIEVVRGGDHTFRSLPTQGEVHALLSRALDGVRATDERLSSDRDSRTAPPTLSSLAQSTAPRMSRT